MYDLQIAEFAEGVHDDTEDDVQADRGDEDEKRQVIHDQHAEVVERVLGRVGHEFLIVGGNGGRGLDVSLRLPRRRRHIDSGGAVNVYDKSFVFRISRAISTNA